MAAIVDIVFPSPHRKEEDAFIRMAEQLSSPSLCFVDGTADLSALQKTTSIILYSGTTNPNMMLKKAALRIVSPGEDVRHILEKTMVDIVFDLEQLQGQDLARQRRSGLNHVIADIAALRKKHIGFSFHSLLSCSGIKRSQLLGRMQQNVLLCRKYKTGMILASFATTPMEMRAPRDLLAVGQMLGMTAGEAKLAIEAVGGIVQRNRSSEK
ncbi:hypothetical protein HYS47_01475 [Candidatus Woesearchaeota archaeon]|nr:hypothetical protein [Candidatus Woesearchaeota archaeon]